jgi:dCMP deaminase
MSIAELVSRRSTCFRRNVGAVITVDHHIVSVGYNGVPAGEHHCTGNGCADPKLGCTRAIHAEVNALTYVPKGAEGRRWVMYVTESPCPTCAREILSSPIGSVFFLHPYRLGEGRDILMGAGIRLYRMTPSGFIIDCVTDELVEMS